MKTVNVLRNYTPPGQTELAVIGSGLEAARWWSLKDSFAWRLARMCICSPRAPHRRADRS